VRQPTPARSCYRDRIAPGATHRASSELAFQAFPEIGIYLAIRGLCSFRCSREPKTAPHVWKAVLRSSSSLAWSWIMLKSVAFAAALVCAFASDANARHYRHHHYRNHHSHRAHAWCGTYMSRYFGKSDPRLALARQWAREGWNAGGPGLGVVVVWAHHVGVITGRTPDGQWIVHSGNDGGAVRTRPRSIAGAIAFRRV
jgi:hypothetical protein